MSSSSHLGGASDPSVSKAYEKASAIEDFGIGEDLGDLAKNITIHPHTPGDEYIHASITVEAKNKEGAVETVKIDIKVPIRKSSFTRDANAAHNKAMKKVITEAIGVHSAAMRIINDHKTLSHSSLTGLDVGASGASAKDAVLAAFAKGTHISFNRSRSGDMTISLGRFDSSGTLKMSTLKENATNRLGMASGKDIVVAQGAKVGATARLAYQIAIKSGLIKTHDDSSGSSTATPRAGNSYEINTKNLPKSMQQAEPAAALDARTAVSALMKRIEGANPVIDASIKELQEALANAEAGKPITPHAAVNIKGMLAELADTMNPIRQLSGKVVATMGKLIEAERLVQNQKALPHAKWGTDLPAKAKAAKAAFYEALADYEHALTGRTSPGNPKQITTDYGLSHDDAQKALTTAYNGVVARATTVDSTPRAKLDAIKVLLSSPGSAEAKTFAGKLDALSGPIVQLLTSSTPPLAKPVTEQLTEFLEHLVAASTSLQSTPTAGQTSESILKDISDEFTELMEDHGSDAAFFPIAQLGNQTLGIIADLITEHATVATQTAPPTDAGASAGPSPTIPPPGERPPSPTPPPGDGPSPLTPPPDGGTTAGAVALPPATGGAAAATFAGADSLLETDLPPPPPPTIRSTAELEGLAGLAAFNGDEAAPAAAATASTPTPPAGDREAAAIKTLQEAARAEIKRNAESHLAPLLAEMERLNHAATTEQNRAAAARLIKKPNAAEIASVDQAVQSFEAYEAQLDAAYRANETEKLASLLQEYFPAITATSTDAPYFNFKARIEYQKGVLAELQAWQSGTTPAPDRQIQLRGWIDMQEGLNLDADSNKAFDALKGLFGEDESETEPTTAAAAVGAGGATAAVAGGGKAAAAEVALSAGGDGDGAITQRPPTLTPAAPRLKRGTGQRQLGGIPTERAAAPPPPKAPLPAAALLAAARVATAAAASRAAAAEAEAAETKAAVATAAKLTPPPETASAAAATAAAVGDVAPPVRSPTLTPPPETGPK